MTLPSTATAPANKTLHQDFADISPSSLFVRPRPVWSGSHYLHVNCINPREGIPAGDECCDRLATVRINCRESKSRAQHLCQEVLAEVRVGRYGSFLSIRLRGWKGATLIKLFDRVGGDILLTHAGRTSLARRLPRQRRKPGQPLPKSQGKVPRRDRKLQQSPEAQ